MERPDLPKLYFFTYSFPYGLGEEWKFQELERLLPYFSQIVVIPFTGDASGPARQLPAAIHVLDPLVTKPPAGEIVRAAGLMIRHPALLLKELRDKIIFRPRARIYRLVDFLSTAAAILRHNTMKRLLANSDEDTIWYFYWGRGSSDAIPFLPPFRRRMLVVRLHRFDVLESTNGGYIPLRRPFYQRADKYLFVSEHGFRELSREHPHATGKFEISRLGTKSIGRSKPSGPGVFHIVSCSAVVPIKRVQLIAGALKLIRDPVVKWTHLGDGPSMKKLKADLTGMPGNISVTLAGQVHPREVLPFFTDNEVDLFLHVSETEGVPVAIMEALSSGIPVMATDAGGTREVVDHSVGRLLPVELNAEQLAGHISEFMQLEDSTRTELREAAFRRYLDRCDMDTCTNKLIGQFGLRREGSGGHTAV